MPNLAKDQNGMTLMELMIGFAVFAILLALSMSVMIFSTKVLSSDSDKDRLKMVGDEMYALLSDELSFATHLQILPEGSDPAAAKYDHIILIQDGELLMGPKGGPYVSPYESDIYLNTALTLSATVESSYVLSFGLEFIRTTSGEADTVYSTDSSIRLINLAAGTDDVVIEGSGTTVNPVISYNSEPYSIEEGYEEGEEFTSPYTVACYTENNEPVPLIDGTTYYPGTIVEDDDGEFWQVVQQVTYYRQSPVTVPGHPGSYLWKSLEEEWKNNALKSVYEYHDVVSYRGSYYMSTLNGNLNTWIPEGAHSYGWVEVYWFDDYNDQDDRMLGWSLNSSQYRSIYTVYP